MRILIIALSDLRNDPRVFRQISWLSQSHDVTCMGYRDPGIGKVRFIRIDPPQRSRLERISLVFRILIRDYDAFLRKKFRNLYGMEVQILHEQYDVIIANDIDTLPFALAIKKTAKVLFDAHEYFPREFEDSRVWNFLYRDYRLYQCRRYLGITDHMITVCDGIADEYFRNFSLKPDVITNAADYVDSEVIQQRSKTIRIIHHGGINPSRKIETMIEMMDHADPRFTLDLMLVRSGSSPDYFRRIKEMVESRSNVHLREPVDMSAIVPTIHGYDIGLYILEPNNFNNAHALPNKFFEFIQARLMIAIGPSPEMAKLVKQYDLGFVAQDFSPRAMAERLNSLTAEQIQYYKMQSHKAARELSSERNMERMGELITRIVT